MCRCPGSGPRSRTARRRSPGIWRWRTRSPPLARRMRAAGLVCLGAGAGLIRADLRAVHGTDVICRSGGCRGHRPRRPAAGGAGPVPLPRPAAGRGGVRRDRAGLRRDRSRPPEHHHPADPVAVRRGRAAPAGHLPAARDLAGRGRGAARPGHVHARRRDHLLPAARRPAGRPGTRRRGRTRSGCSGRPGRHDPAAGPGGHHRPLRHRAADRAAAADRGARPAAAGPHPAAGHADRAGRPPARPPDPRPPGTDRAARGRPAAARRARGLEARPAPADLPADRAHLRPRRGRAGQGRPRRAALRSAAAPLRRPAGGIHPG